MAARLLKVLTSVEHESHRPAENLSTLQISTMNINSAQHHLHLHASCCEGYQEPQVLVHDTVYKRTIIRQMILISQHITRSNSTKQRPKGKVKPDCDLVNEAHLLVDVSPRRVLEICGDGAPLNSKSPCPMGDGRSNTIVKQNFPHQQLS